MVFSKLSGKMGEVDRGTLWGSEKLAEHTNTYCLIKFGQCQWGVERRCVKWKYIWSALYAKLALHLLLIQQEFIHSRGLIDYELILILRTHATYHFLTCTISIPSFLIMGHASYLVARWKLISGCPHFNDSVHLYQDYVLRRCINYV